MNQIFIRFASLLSTLRGASLAHACWLEGRAAGRRELWSEINGTENIEHSPFSQLVIDLSEEELKPNKQLGPKRTRQPKGTP